jgi:hypothetical protein
MADRVGAVAFACRGGWGGWVRQQWGWESGWRDHAGLAG